MPKTKLSIFLIAKKIFQKAKRTSKRLFFSNKTIQELKSHDDEIVRKMGKVLKRSLEKDLTKEEQKIADKVESLRSSYKSTSLTIAATNEENNPAQDDVAYILRVASKSRLWLIFQLVLIREFNIQRGLEFGTCLGISAAYQAAAIKLNNGDELVTMEGLKSRHEFSENLFDELNIENIEARQGDFNELIPNVLDKNNLYDYLFLDGDHTYESTIQYFNQVLPYLKEQSIVILDDIRWSKEMERAWKEIRNHNQVIYSFDLELVGVCIIGRKERKEHFKITLW